MLTLLDHLFIGKDVTLFLNHPARKSPESSAKAGTTTGPREESKVGLLLTLWPAWIPSEALGAILPGKVLSLVHPQFP